MSTAIVKHEPSSSITTAEHAAWTREQVDLIKRAICPKGISDDEFQVFIHQCRTTGMDPLTKEAFCVPRRTNVGSKESPRWVTNHVFQPSADGMRARAARFPDFVSVRSAAVHEKDLRCEIDTDAGAVKHSYDPTKPRGRLLGAWAKVTKRGDDPVVVWLPIGSRPMKGDFWAADPDNMMCKCSEVAALRRAYPVHFAGQYVPEELPPEEATPSRAEMVLSTAGGTSTEEETHALPPPGPVVEFGQWKGLALDTLDTDQKRAAIAYAEEQMTLHPKMKASAKEVLKKNLDAIRASMSPVEEVVEVEMVGPSVALPLSHPDAQPPEPGAEG